MADKINTGDQAPDFTLPNQRGENVTLSDFRDNYEVFTEAGAEVIGISSDSVKSHDSFARHHSLPFTLVSDHGGEVRKRYGVPSTMGLLPGRVTYVIDRSGVVRHVFNSQVNIGAHITNALKIVQEIQA